MKLSAAGARLSIAVFSLAITGLLICFLLIAPEIGLPFNQSRHENISLLQIVFPVFLGYLGSASHFVIRSPQVTEVAVADEQLLWILVFGPFLLYLVINITLFATFFLANREGGSGMSLEDLSKWFSIALGLLTCTISVISSHVFGTSGKMSRTPKSG
jgi:hypothetical protein